MAKKKYLDILDGVAIYKNAKSYTDDQIEAIAPYETAGGINTLFDTEVDETNEILMFLAGNSSADYDGDEKMLIVEGAVIGDTLIIS